MVSFYVVLDIFGLKVAVPFNFLRGCVFVGHGDKATHSALPGGHFAEPWIRFPSNLFLTTSSSLLLISIKAPVESGLLFSCCRFGLSKHSWMGQCFITQDPCQFADILPSISSSLLAVRYGLTMIGSLWNLTGAWAALVPRHLSNYRSIQ